MIRRFGVLRVNAVLDNGSEGSSAVTVTAVVHEATCVNGGQRIVGGAEIAKKLSAFTQFVGYAQNNAGGILDLDDSCGIFSRVGSLSEFYDLNFSVVVNDLTGIFFRGLKLDGRLFFNDLFGYGFLDLLGLSFLGFFRVIYVDQGRIDGTFGCFASVGLKHLVDGFL